MSDDAELAVFRRDVNCAALLERMAGWTLDKQESSKRALKYRGGPGQIIIVNHDGRGWWDPQSRDKGDVFNLVQRLDPELNFGQIRKLLRGFVGIAPAHPPFTDRSRAANALPPALRWARRHPIRPGDPAWTYLSRERAIPDEILAAAVCADCIRIGAYGSAWFAHRKDGDVCHVEIRGPGYRGALTGGDKTLFRLGAQSSTLRRLAVLEAPIDALSLAAIKGLRSDTLYAATGGGMGPGTVEAINTHLEELPAVGGELVAATDGDGPGDRYASILEDLATAACVRFQRRRPPADLDWNDVLKGRGA